MPNIIQYFGTCLENSTSKIILEYMECDLTDWVFKKSLNQRLNVFDKFIKDISNGLTVIHNMNIIHNDIKPANILVRGNTFKFPYILLFKIISLY